MHMFRVAWIYSIHVCCTKKNKEVKENTSFGWNCWKMSCALTSRRMRKDPRVYCSCNFLFKQDGLSSSQSAVLRGFALHSEQIWIRLWKLTQGLLRCMNINVTSDWVEWWTGKYQFLMSFVFVTNYFILDIFDVFFSLWAGLVCIFSVEPSWLKWSYLQQSL